MIVKSSLMSERKILKFQLSEAFFLGVTARRTRVGYELRNLFLFFIYFFNFFIYIKNKFKKNSMAWYGIRICHAAGLLVVC